MCGITGKIYYSKDKQIKENEIRAMNEKIKHRGPDDEGVYIDKNIGLGHVRLSIIDLSSAGHQPMSNEDESIYITYNGEIYNFKELRVELENKDHKFKSNTDTEVIIHLYEEYGTECLQYLRGMFAFVIYDKKKDIIFAARDRIGKKPLKYYSDPSCFIFASELKAILVNSEVKREIDFESMSSYLALGYLVSPYTGFVGIKKLPPGHFLVIKNGNITIQRYWNLDFSKKLNLSLNDWKEVVLEKIEESVKIRMISDVPLGAFLSGGIDSSAVVALMARNSNKPIKTFSIGFREKKYNELPFAKIIAEKFKTDHTEIVVKPKAIEILPQLIYQYEEPYADSSAIPTFYVSKATRQYVKVALNGDGGDENFVGYPRYIAWQLQHTAKHIPYFILRLSNILGPNYRMLTDIINKNRSYKPYEQYHNLAGFSFFPLWFLDNKDVKSLLHYKKLFDNKFSNLDKALFTDLMTYLPDDLLVKVDIASMANSLEARSPLLDQELLELTAKIPSSQKFNRLKCKKLFKYILKDILPPEIFKHKKMGFSIPLDHWLRSGDLKELARHEILDNKESLSVKLFSYSFLKKMFEEHDRKKYNHGHRIWSLLTLELWRANFFGK